MKHFKIQFALSASTYLLIYCIYSFVVWDLQNPFQWIINLPSYDGEIRFSILITIVMFQAIAFVLIRGHVRQSELYDKMLSANKKISILESVEAFLRLVEMNYGNIATIMNNNSKEEVTQWYGQFSTNLTALHIAIVSGLSTSNDKNTLDVYDVAKASPLLISFKGKFVNV